MSDLLNSLSSDYDQAQRYYIDLKNKMLDDIMNKVKISPLLRISPLELRDKIETNILQNATNWQSSFIEGKGALDRVEAEVSKILENQDTSGIKSLMEELQKKAKELDVDGDKYTRHLKDLLKANQKKIIEQTLSDRQFFTSMLSSSPSADATDITNQLSSYFARYLYSQIMESQEISSRAHYELSLGGFYKEAAEYEILNKKLGKLLNVFHAGSRNTELDILITSLDNIETALKGNEQITKIISAGDFSDVQQDLINQITWYGEQVKGWSLDANTNVHSIGNREELFQAFLNEQNVEQSYDTVAAARFLGRFKNILLALGPTNVLFSSGGRRQWMSDFLADMRARSFVLVFGRPNMKSPLTNKVNIERVMTQKGNIRDRFKT